MFTFENIVAFLALVIIFGVGLRKCVEYDERQQQKKEKDNANL